MKSPKAFLLAALSAFALSPFLHALEYGLWVKPELGGWTEAKDGAMAGTVGRNLFTDAFKLGGLPFPADFRFQASGRGWRQWTPCDGRDCSSYGRSLEAIQFRFPTGIPEGKRLYARVYLRGKGWQKTLLIQQMSVLGTTELGIPLEAIQLSYVEGETGREEELVRKADERFNRLLPAGGEPPPVSSSAYAPVEPGLGRWSWDNTSREFTLEPGGIAKGYKDDRPGKWGIVKRDAPGKTYQLDWKNSDGSTSTDILTVSWDGSRMTGESVTHYKLIASRVDGLSQLRPLEDEAAKKRVAELEWKLESLMLPKVALEQTEFGAAVDYFRLQCLKEDRDEENATKRGFNVVVAPPAGFKPPKITLSMENIHAGKVLEEIARQAGLVVQAESFALVLKSKDEPFRVPVIQGQAATAAASIIIPVVAFEGNPLSKTVEFLKRTATEQAGEGKVPDIRIVEGADPAVVVSELQLRNVPLSEALRYLAAVTNQPLVSSDAGLHFGTMLPAPRPAAEPSSKPGSNFVVNGSFEEGPKIEGRLLTVKAGSPEIPGWQVLRNDVEVIGSVEWPAAEGSRSLDLNGVRSSSIEQEVKGLVKGKIYRLSFSLSGNPYTGGGDRAGDGDRVKSLSVSSGPVVADFEFDVSDFQCRRGNTAVRNMGWTTKSIDFVADGPAQKVRFTSTDPEDSMGGPVIDNVILALAPEGASPMANKPAGGAGDKAAAGSRMDPALGSWAWGHKDVRFILELDGSISQPPDQGRWRCVNPGQTPRRYDLTWTNGAVDTLTLDPEGKFLKGANKAGKLLEAARVGPPPPDAHPGAMKTDDKGYRTWTDAKTGRAFEARIITKKSNGSEAQVARKDDGKSFWLRTDTLSDADQFYVRYWVDPDAQVTARVVASGNPGWKKVRVTVTAGPEPLVVRVTGQIPPPDKMIAGLPRPPFTRIVATGERIQFEFASGTNYAVEATANGAAADREEDMGKTGI